MMTDSDVRVPVHFKAEHRLPHELVVAALLIVVIWGLWAGKAFIIPVALAGLLAFLGSPLVRWLSRRRVPEMLAIVIAALALIVPLAFVGYMLVRQAQSLLMDFPAIVESLRVWISGLSETAIGQRFRLAEHLTLDAVAEQVGDGAGESMKFIALGLQTAFAAGVELVLIFLFAVGMLASRNHLYLSAEKMLATYESLEAAKVLEAVTNMIERFLLTKLVVIAIISVLTVFALQMLGLKYSFLLGIMTGALTLIPEVGFLVSLVPVTTVAIATGHSAWSTTWILGSMVVVHFLEANVFTPKLVGKSMNLNVLSTFIGLFGGGLLWGVWGMLLSVPMLGILRIIFSSTVKLEPWAFLLSQREDRQFGQNLLTTAFKASQTIVAAAKPRKMPRKPPDL